MTPNLDHLPERQQEELEAVVGHLLRGFDAAVAGGTQGWRRNAKIYKIILFGSYARGDFVDAPETGYQSDFDILVVVSDDKLTDVTEYWWETEQKIAHDPKIGRIVNLIVHSQGEINEALDGGQFFFREVIDQGIALYEVPGHAFHPLKPLTPQEGLNLAASHFTKQSKSVRTSLVRAADAIARGYEDDWPQKAAFDLHQATEAAYIAVLLVIGFYSPRSHNIKFLRTQAEVRSPDLASAWPRETRAERKPFDKLKRAYVEARYNQDTYKITTEELLALKASVEGLVALVRTTCEAALDQLRDAAERSQAP